jgi:hypothetical protein
VLRIIKALCAGRSWINLPPSAVLDGIILAVMNELGSAFAGPPGRTNLELAARSKA